MGEVLIRIICGCLGPICFWLWNRNEKYIEKYREEWHNDPANSEYSLHMHGNPVLIVLGILLLAIAFFGVSIID